MKTSRKAAAVITIALGGAIGLAACGPATSTSPPPPTVTRTALPSGAASSAAVPGVAAPVASDTTAPDMTVAQQQAVQSARSYLDMGSGFSRESLLKQLTSSYGEGFSEADAEFAVNYLKPDWNAQAVECAKGYLALESFSRSRLIEQLTSKYGNGFTEAQAEYAANKVGL